MDLWKEDYNPPAAAAPVEPGATDDAPGSFQRKLTRGPMASEAEAFQPHRRAGRGSSGDPSEIAPPKTGMTPPARPRPKSGEMVAFRATGDRDPRLGSGQHGLPPSTRRGPPAVEQPAQEGPLLEPRRRPPTSSISRTPPPAPSAAAPPPPVAEPAPPPREPASPAVLDAIQAANDAAKNRKGIDKSDIASFANALDFDAQASGPGDISGEAKIALSETTADENPTATAQASLAASRTRGVAAEPPPVGPHMPHYLVTQVLGEPVALSRNQVVRIGRGEENEVIFPLSQVSRFHAEVRYDGQAGAYVIIDRNSINGTFVNGKAIKRRRLADGDRIGIGPFTIVYRVSTGGTKLRAMDETDVIRPGSLAGEIADMPIADVARFIEALRKTGELTIVTSAGERGTVFFRDGRPVHAEFKVTLGQPAAVAMFKLQAGNFRFAVKPIEVAKATIGQTLESLLTEATNA